MVLFHRTPRPSGGTLIPTPFAPVDDGTDSFAVSSGMSAGMSADMPPGAVEALNTAERQWTTQQRELLVELCDAILDAPTVGRLFDRVHGAWLTATRPAEPELLVNVFGLALGDLVAQRVPGLSWAVYRDDIGTELVLAHASNPLVVFPVAAVAARWGTAEPGWFTGYVDEAARLSSAVLAGGFDAVPWVGQGPDDEGRDHHGRGEQPQGGTPHTGRTP